ncbi:polysaccharide biosynthesis tyrosine autokinase [candidate division KSB1 bacterium]|nr:polysaccharide biosynthesis tyrosine autokinase [candidate division KSB1 bacterium]
MNSLPTGKNPYNGNGFSDHSSSEMRQRDVTFRDYVRVFYKGRRVILISFFTVLAATVFFTLTTEPVYEASAKIMVEEQGSMGESLFDFTGMMKKETMINNQVEILKSRTLAEQVIRELQISEQADRLRLLGNPPKDESHARGIFGWFRNLSSSNNGDEDEDPVSRFASIVDQMRNNISVNPIRNTDMIEIRVSAFSPQEAAYVGNTVARVFQERNRLQSQQEVRQVKNFLEEQLDQYEDELGRSEEALRDYQEKAKVVALDQETQELVRKLAEFETLYNESKTDYQANQQRLAYIDKQLDREQANFDIETISSQPYLAEMKRQIAEKEADLAKYLASMVEIGTFAHNESQIQMRERQIDALKEKFKQEVSKIAAAQFVDPAVFSGALFTSKIEVETELQSLEPKVKALEAIVATYNTQLEALPEKSLTLARLMRKRQSDEKIYIMLQEKYQESRITEVGQLGNVRIIDPAIPPKAPVKPKTRLNIILGLLVGLGLGVGIAFVLEYLDNSVQDMEDVEAIGLTVMATIPHIKPEEPNGVLSRIRIESDPEAEDINERLVTHLKPRSPISEAYRTLRTHILFSNPENGKKTLLVTSSGPKEGKSTTVSNLAITFAQMGNRTLLIDADLRRPILHKLFNIDKSVGLTNILVGRASLEESVKKVPELPNLDILNCGVIPPNPAELLGSRNMKELLDYAKTQYNMILIDTPPTLAVTDATILASVVDGLLLVIRSGSTQREAARRAYEQLKKVNAPVLGAILNGIQVANVYGSTYYYYHYHYYAGAEGKKTKKANRKRKRSETGVNRTG